MSISNFAIQQGEYIMGRVAKKKRVPMEYPELARYFTALIGDNLDRIVADSDVGRTTVYNVRNGKRARPENYERLALAIGKNRIEQREIYKNLMRFSGYLDLLPNDSEIDEQLDKSVLDEIRARYPEIYAAAVAIVEARRRGDLPSPGAGNRGVG